MPLLPTYTKYSLGTAAALVAASAGTVTSNATLINFTNLAASAAIPANTQINLIIDTINTNPSNTRIVSPFTITTSSSTAQI